MLYAAAAAEGAALVMQATAVRSAVLCVCVRARARARACVCVCVCE